MLAFFRGLPEALTKAEVGRALEICGGYARRLGQVAQAGHISRTVLHLIRGEVLVEQEGTVDLGVLLGRQGVLVDWFCCARPEVTAEAKAH